MNMEEIITTNMILKELKEFRAENEKRWEENEKRWEENNKKIDLIDKRVEKLESAKESDKQEVFRIMNSIDETVRSEFGKLHKELDVRFNKIEAILEENKMEHKQFKEHIQANTSRINLHQVRIEKLENWKDELDTGKYLSV